MDLYRGVVFEPNPGLFYLGMQNQFYTFGMFDAQSYYVRDIILGRIHLPPTEDMKADSQKWREREEKLQSVTEMMYVPYTWKTCCYVLVCMHHENIGFYDLTFILTQHVYIFSFDLSALLELHVISWFQGDYWKGLHVVQETDCPSFDVDAANLRLETWVNDKRENILDYRDKVYPSLVTGQMSPSPRHKWVDAKRDCHFLHYFPTSKKQTAPSDTRHEDACTS